MNSEPAFERFNDEARNALKYAHEEARILGHHHIDTAHLLLGLVCDPHSVASRVLQTMGLDLVTVYHTAMPVASQVWSIGEEARLTEGAKRAIERAVYETNQLGHRNIGSEHLLLGMFTGQNEAAETTLVGLGASLDETRKQVLAVLEMPPMPSTEGLSIESARQEHARQEYTRAHTARTRRSRPASIATNLIIFLVSSLATFFFLEVTNGGDGITTTLSKTFDGDIQFTPGGLAQVAIAGFLLIVGIWLLIVGPRFCVSLVLSLRAGNARSRKLREVEQLKFQSKLLLIILVPLWLFIELAVLLWAILPQSWWLWAALVWFFYSTVVTRFGTELILSHLYKITSLPQDRLAQRLTALVEDLKMPIRGIFVMNRRDQLLRANALCVSWGKTCRIILTDSLLQCFPPDEIEVIVAHELGHCLRKDVLKRVIVRSLGMLCLLAVIQYLPPQIRIGFKNSNVLLVFFLCILCIFSLWQFLYLFYIRLQEYWADEYALQVTGKIQVFKDAMTRLVNINFTPARRRRSNLSAPSHPTLAQRLKHADKFAARQSHAAGSEAM